ncbi:uncharacterized protein CDV56_102011 [Aspergillus thermomutatus]|uniref:Fungal N-terminal domain-containing protein n=1 Tax=Aspergillus thermomutatus TaxID=41047 RepID=A0A397HCA8_ASPTH|nr:uncharacterized protein CDV56_102011 [Aspergillus thermomutatus]RHZ60682.1 hypothetical protein CDV56_102011 [Aspergillus thermomutatus]
MSDPLSVTASAAGIISLGLQVTQGIFSFCSAWKGYGGDMEDLRNKATALANGLRHLDHVLHKTSSVDPAFKTQAVDLLDSSKIMMEKLEKLRAKLPTPPTKRLATETAREIKRKMLYTFEKQTLMEMRSMIDSLQGNIDTALNILQVHQGTRLLDDVATHTALSLDIRDQLAEHTARLDSLNRQLTSHLPSETQLVSSGRTADVRWESDYSKLRQVINYLIREGVPTDMLTDMNMTALDCMLRNLQPKPLVHALISDMANAGCYITDNALKLWNRPLIRYIILHHPGAVCLSYPALVIFQETERELVTLVGSGQLCGDHIIGEYTALQLATGWPAGIKILLDAGADMTKDGKGNKYTHGYSNPLSWVIPSNCPASLLVFLRAGASLQPNHIGLAIYLSTPEVIDTLVNELIRRRQSLRELALLALPKHISYTLRLSQDVLPDANAPVIFDALRDAGIPVNTSMDPRGLHRGDVGHEYGTIFHERQLDRQLMDRLYDAGFVDVDTLDSAGYSPLMIAGFNSSTREDCQRIKNPTQQAATAATSNSPSPHCLQSKKQISSHATVEFPVFSSPLRLTDIGSICHINGYLLTYVPTSKIIFEMDKDAVTVYPPFLAACKAG